MRIEKNRMQVVAVVLLICGLAIGTVGWAATMLRDNTPNELLETINSVPLPNAGHRFPQITPDQLQALAIESQRITAGAATRELIEICFWAGLAVFGAVLVAIGSNMLLLAPLNAAVARMWGRVSQPRLLNREYSTR